MDQLAFSIDLSRCSGCFACVVACQDQNDSYGEDVAFRQVVTQEMGGSSPVAISSISIACFHCGEAPCLNVCPTGAIYERDETGIVDIDRDLCIGCHNCLQACPFGAPQFARDGKMAKCDMCHSRVMHGMEPACVCVCPTKALDAGPLVEISKKKAEKSSTQILKSSLNKPSMQGY